MAYPSKEALLDWAENYVALWNAGDKDGWIENYRKVAPGEFRMLDPVGTPEKLGFAEITASWDLFQSFVKFRIQPDTLMVCGNEVAWLLENHITNGGETTIGYSIETYRFNEDGSLDIRTYYRVPEKTDDTLGDAFKTYLPDE